MGTIDTREVIKMISEELLKSNLNVGDFSDLGNEIGFILGSIFTNQPMDEQEIKDFIRGFEHGASGTHF